MARKEKNKALRHKDFLTLLSKSKSKKRRNTLIDVASKNEILAIVECIYNFLNGRVKYTENQKQKLTPYKTSLRKIAKNASSLKRNKEIIKQEGGFLPALIPLALGTLGKLLPNLL